MGGNHSPGVLGALAGLSNEAALACDCRAGVPGGPGARKLVLLKSQEPDQHISVLSKMLRQGTGKSQICRQDWRLEERGEEVQLENIFRVPRAESHGLFLGHLQLHPVLGRELSRVPDTSDCHRSFLIA